MGAHTDINIAFGDLTWHLSTTVYNGYLQALEKKKKSTLGRIRLLFAASIDEYVGMWQDSVLTALVTVWSSVTGKAEHETPFRVVPLDVLTRV